MKTICICGGGSLGHVIAGWLASRNHARVNVLTRRPERWSREIVVDTPDGLNLVGQIAKISNRPEEIIPESDVILLCLPGYMIARQLKEIKDYLNPSAFVGSECERKNRTLSSNSWRFIASNLASSMVLLCAWRKHLLGCGSNVDINNV